jgi:hypothetical protein
MGDPALTRELREKALREAHDIELARDALIDWDIVVDDRRRDVDRAVELFREAVAERERAKLRLASLIAEYPGPVA